MLSRTADHLFWMSRYTERAENLARLLDVTWQMSMVPQSLAAANQNWNAVLVLNSLETNFARKYREVNGDNVLRFMVSDPDNPSSLYSCLRMSRENAHAVRGTITAEMWETLNATWLELRGQSYEQLTANGPGEFFEWVKTKSSLLRGVTLGTMLQDEAFHFIRLGTLLERADNTARILDVQFRMLAPDGIRASTAVDYYRYTALLLSVSAFEIYRKVYRDRITPERVAELLLLRADTPRSLHRCVAEVDRHLQRVANAQSGETLRRAGELHALLRYARIDLIVEEGFHEFLAQCLGRVADLGRRIARDFLVSSVN